MMERASYGKTLTKTKRYKMPLGRGAMQTETFRDRLHASVEGYRTA